MAKAKPFIKWVGGKGQLIEQIDAQLPADFGNWQDVTYIEPFVGGGAMLFYMLQRYPNIRHAVIGDINADLITCYTTVRDCPDALVASLKEIEQAYRSLPGEQETNQTLGFFCDFEKIAQNVEDVKLSLCMLNISHWLNGYA